MQKRERSPGSKQCNVHKKSAQSISLSFSEGNMQQRNFVLKFLAYFENEFTKFFPDFISSLDPTNCQQSKNLLKSLSRVAGSGLAPSFSDPGARSGYIRRRFKIRSAQVRFRNFTESSFRAVSILARERFRIQKKRQSFWL